MRSLSSVPDAASAKDWRERARLRLRLESGPVEIAVGEALLVALPEHDPVLVEGGGPFDKTPASEWLFITGPNDDGSILDSARHAAACYARATWFCPGATLDEKRAALVVLIGLGRLLRDYEVHPECPDPLGGPKGASTRTLLNLVVTASDVDQRDPLVQLAWRVLQETEPEDRREFTRCLRAAWANRLPILRTAPQRPAEDDEKEPPSKSEAPACAPPPTEDATPDEPCTEEKAIAFLVRAIREGGPVPSQAECARHVGVSRQMMQKLPGFLMLWRRAKAAEKRDVRGGYRDAATGNLECPDGLS